MKKCGKLLSTLLALAVLSGMLPVHAAETGYNGQSGAVGDFDRSYYDATVEMYQLLSKGGSGDVEITRPEEGFEWPAGKNILLDISGGVWEQSDLDFVEVPDGVIVDAYFFDYLQDTYTFWGRFDTTGGASGSAIGAPPESITIQQAQELYDEIIEVYDNDDFQWPSGGTVMIELRNMRVIDINTTIPAGLIVDVYETAGGYDRTFLIRYDTTDGQPMKVTNGQPPRTEPYTNSYDDVQPGDWHYTAVMEMTEGGLLTGYGDGWFGPDDVITKAQLNTIFNRLVQSYGGERPNWDPIPVDWSTDNIPLRRGDAAYMLVDMLLDSGKVNLFDRADADSLLQKAEETGAWVSTYVNTTLAGQDVSGKPFMFSRYYGVWKDTWDKEIEIRQSAGDFPDSAAVTAWATDWAENGDGKNILDSLQGRVDLGVRYLCTAWNLGMFSGTDDAGTFSPNSLITRAELCQVLYNMGWTVEDVLI